MPVLRMLLKSLFNKSMEPSFNIFQPVSLMPAMMIEKMRRRSASEKEEVALSFIGQQTHPTGVSSA